MHSNDRKIDLTGFWEFRLDPENRGIKEKWYQESFNEKIWLPGSTDEAGYGVKPLKNQIHIGRLTREYSYEGAAWYSVEIEVDDTWLGKDAILYLERCHWETRVWIDGESLGCMNSLSGPHVYLINGGISVGKHRITICVDNTKKLNLGFWPHSVCEETQTNWNGMIGRMELICLGNLFLKDVQVYPCLNTKTITVKGIIRNSSDSPLDCRIQIKLSPANDLMEIVMEKEEDLLSVKGEQAFEVNVPITANMKPWDEFDPNLYIANLFVQGSGNGNILNCRTDVTFGIRKVSTFDRQLLINDRPVFLRGALHNAESPLTGYPSVKVEDWEFVIRKVKEYGLNHFRFHSWCPPEAAFTAADRLGFYFLPECPFSADIYRDYPEAKYLEQEAFHMLKTYGNHPSFVMMGFGNEMRKDEDFFDALLNNMREADNRRIYTCDVNNDRFAKRMSPLYNAQFFVTRHTQYGSIRLAQQKRFKSMYSVDGNDLDYTAEIRNIHMPVILHEAGEWAVHPDFSEISKYTGHLKPYNLEHFRSILKKRGLLPQVHQFQLASGALSRILYKEELEACFRTPGMAGFQLLNIQDFPGQGDALVGLLD
ncbi:MAG TPA: glycoside hydrolase family 2, partial [Clostridiales bacterium]|nr:glycoside hydrolase family 2 [Clostridiales bacterium]